MNTQVKKAPNGKKYSISNEFKVGDIVVIHNTITGEESYRAIIKFYNKSEKGHWAKFTNNMENTLGSALVIEL